MNAVKDNPVRAAEDLALMVWDDLAAGTPADPEALRAHSRTLVG
jgi:hypothetical protein